MIHHNVIGRKYGQLYRFRAVRISLTWSRKPREQANFGACLGQHVSGNMSQATKKGRIAPPLSVISVWKRLLRSACTRAKLTILLVADETELGHARCLNDIQHLG